MSEVDDFARYRYLQLKAKASQGADEGPSVASKILPDIGNMIAGYGGAVAEGAYNMPKRALDTGLQMASGTPYAETPSGQQDVQLVQNAPAQAAEIVRPAVHPVDYFKEHPVQQTLNVLGLLSGLAGGAKSALAPAKEGSIGNQMSARITSQALDMNPMATRKLAMKMGVSPEQAVLDLGNKANELIPNLVKPLDSANSKFTKVLNAHDTAGAKIGEFANKFTSETKGSFPEAQETIDSLRNAAKEYYQIDGGDLALEKTADRLEALQKEGKLDFNRLSKVKSEIGKGFMKTETPPGTEDIYDILNTGAQKVVDRLSIDDPSIAPELAHLKQVYTTTSRLLPSMVRTASREVSGSGVAGGVLSKAIPSAIGGLIGGPVGALGGAAAKYAQELIAPDLTKNLAYMGMKSASKINSGSGLPIAALANNAIQSSSKNISIEDLIKKLKAKYDARRKM